MKEIEVKVKINNRKEILDKLKELGCTFSEPKLQNDIIFVPAGFTLGQDLKKGINFLRIRKSNNKIIFTLKQPQSNELDCIEKEIEINDAEIMADIIKLLGYQEAVRVNKTRIEIKYQDYTICIDQVDGLGDFIETERLIDETLDQDADKVQEASLVFLESIGVDITHRQDKGYDTLMYIKNNS
ncbi:class IV adenylate cyclase [Candidatus Parcubacteria bacterium]|nr:MAG: class IV adenylate cyclase [Candidatus Parcubacteria bacterium]